MTVDSMVDLSEWGRAMCCDVSAPGVVIETVVTGGVTWARVQWANGECGWYSARQLEVK